MANHPQRQHPVGTSAASAPAGRRSGLDAAVFSEPEVRRWPHPVPGTPPMSSEEPCLDASLLQYFRCAMSYQNQLLADIRALLEQLVSGKK